MSNPRSYSYIFNFSKKKDEANKQFFKTILNRIM